jgi:L-aminopeptidase/D-esterase-like protein
MGGSTYYVGENGPELFTPFGAGRITPNGLGGGSGMTVVVNVQGSVVHERDLAVAVRDNIAQLMRRRGLNPSILGV